MADTKAICLPSRDQVALSAPVLIVVSCFASPPDRSMTQSCVSPERFDSKRIFLPSGLQCGLRSFLPGTLVSWRGSPFSVEATQMADEVLLPARSTLVTT